MRIQAPNVFSELLQEHTPPCISIYMPTHRAKPPANENPVRLRNLVRTAENEIHKVYPRSAEMEQVLKRLRDLPHDGAVWGQPGDALAVFASLDCFKTVWLQRPVRELVQVADSFHVKPLIRAHQFSGRFQVLCLTQGNIAIYEGDHDDLQEVPLRNVPRTLVEALGEELTEPHYTHARHTGRGQSAPAIHGHHDNKDEQDNDLERFFRMIDRAVWENHSRESGLPLILCGVTRHHDRFRKVSHNINLIPGGIRLNPDSISIDRLHEQAWKVIKPYYDQQVEKVIEEYGRAQAYQQGSEDIAQVAQAATQSRVGTLLVDADKHIGGKIEPNGEVTFGDLNSAEFDDILDDIAEQVVKTGGQVLVIPHDQMPTETGLAAIYRF